MDKPLPRIEEALDVFMTPHYYAYIQEMVMRPTRVSRHIGRFATREAAERRRHSREGGMSEYSDIVGSFEAEEGYPTDTWIDAFNGLKMTAFTPQEAADFLVNRLPEMKKSISCMSVDVTDSDDCSKLIEYHTGGWSGAEDLIEAMLGQFWIRHYHTTWHRGGHFYFEVPNGMLAGAA